MVTVAVVVFILIVAYFWQTRKIPRFDGKEQTSALESDLPTLTERKTEVAVDVEKLKPTVVKEINNSETIEDLEEIEKALSADFEIDDLPEFDLTFGF